MMNKWWEYQNALKPVSLSNGLGSFTRLRRNHLVARVKAISMHTTMITPVMPSTPFTRARYVGLFSPKYLRSGAYFISDERMSRGKSHTRWFPAWRTTPTTIAAAIVCHYKTSKRKIVLLVIFLVWLNHMSHVCPYYEKPLSGTTNAPIILMINFMLHSQPIRKVSHELPWHGIAWLLLLAKLLWSNHSAHTIKWF